MQEIETTTPTARGQSAQMVWDAILELHNAEKRINRQSIAALTGLRPRVWSLGSRLIEFHSQNKTVAASMIAEKKVSGQRSYRVATRRQSFRRPNMISMRLRRL